MNSSDSSMKNNLQICSLINKFQLVWNIATETLQCAFMRSAWREAAPEQENLFPNQESFSHAHLHVRVCLDCAGISETSSFVS